MVTEPQRELTPKEQRNRKIGIGCAAALVVWLVLLGTLGQCYAEPEIAGDAASGEPSEPAGLTEAQEAKAGQWFVKLTNISNGCDSRMQELGNAMQAVGQGSGSMYEGYAVARETRDSCGKVWQAYRDIEPPGFLNEDAADEAGESCKLSAFVKMEAAETAMEIFDGDMRPSQMDKLGEDLKLARANSIQCVTQASAVMSGEGIDLAELLGEETKQSTEE